MPDADRTKYRLYGAPISYFTGKVRAYLRWKALEYEEVLASAEVYRDVILPRVGFAVIPVVVTPGDETLQDSTEIIEELERRHPQPTTIPAGAAQQLVGQLIELYGDEWLVIPAMHYRWHHNREFAIQSFGELSAPEASAEQQVEIGARRAGPFAKAAVLLGAEPHMHAAIEASYEALLRELDSHFARYPYILGGRPSIADFGLFGPMYAHQYRDPQSGALMRRIAPHLVGWIERMLDPAPSQHAEFLPDDAIAETLLPILRRMMREQLPVLADSAARLRTWLPEHANESVPRTLGMHEYTLDGARGQRIIRPYSLWMLQRARDTYRRLQPAHGDRLDAILRSVDGLGFMTFADPPRLARAGMSVRVES
jgi:glutathione S-transferase